MTGQMLNPSTLDLVCWGTALGLAFALLVWSLIPPRRRRREDDES